MKCVSPPWALFFFLLILPWQTQWIIRESTIGGDAVQYGRLAIYAIDAAAVTVIVISMRARRLSWKKLFALPLHGMLVTALAASVGWSFLSAMWAVEPTVALWTSLHVALAVGLVFALIVEPVGHLSPIMIGLAIGAIVPAALGWWQVLMQSVEPSTLLGIAAQDPSIPGTAVIEHAGGRWLRAYGSFPHPNMFGGFMAVGLVAAIVNASFSRQAHERYVFWFAVAAIAGGLLLSASKTAWLAAALGVGLWTLGLVVVRAKELIAALRFPLVICAIVFVVLGLSLSSILFTRFDTTNRLEAKSLAERQAQWVEATDVLAVPNVWFRGTGTGNQPFALARLKPLLPAWAYQPLHNVPMLILLELGAVGLALVVAIVLITDYLVHAQWRHTLSLSAMSLGLTILTLALFDHYLWTQPSGLYLLAVFLGFNMRAGVWATRANGIASDASDAALDSRAAI